MLPRRIGRYGVTGELGKGAMGVVYKAVDPTIGRAVALKTMRMDGHGGPAQTLLKRFHNEARAAGVLSHRNIVTIYDAGEDHGVFYIAMEFIEGITLAGLLLERKALPAEQVVEVGAQIATGLDYAHSRGVVHRDVKPANIMIAPDGTVKIMDFGIAKADTGLTHSGEVLGTPSYMSPEQVKGRALDGRSDLFSAGVLLYEMVTGEKPFAGQNVATIIYKIINEEATPPRDLDVTIHPGLSAVITKALKKSPDERYQSGAELAIALRSYREVGSATEPTMVLSAAASGGEGSSNRAQAAAAMTDGLAGSDVQPAILPTTIAGERAAAEPDEGSASAVAPALDNFAQEVSDSKVGAPSPRRRLSVAVWIAAAWLTIAAAAVLGAVKTLRSMRPQSRVAPVQNAPAKTNTDIAPAETSTGAGPAVQLPDNGPQPQPLPNAEDASKRSPEPATAAELVITSAPSGAQVEIDGRTSDRWMTPFRSSALKPGTHTVVVNLAGYEAVRRKIELATGGKKSLNFELRPQKAVFFITSLPAGARVFVDGDDTGLKTPAKVAVEAGQHKIALAKAGFHSAQTFAHAGPGQKVTLTTQLYSKSGPAPEPGYGNVQRQPNPFGRLRRWFGGADPNSQGVVSIRTYPKGAQVAVDNLQLPRNTPLRFPLDAGRHQITVKMNGYKTLTRVIQVEKGKAIQIDEVLEPR